MAARKKSTVFRVTGLPASQPDDELNTTLRAAIDDGLSNEEKSKLQIDTAIVPSCYDKERERVALVEFCVGVPEFLSELEANPLEDWQIEMGDTDISFDCHFFGFTQLYTPKPDVPVTADIIAITGLDGHAYGSWRGKGNLGRMWLRDFLSKDLPCCRTMIYGYNSKLSCQGIDTIMDYGRGFMEELKKVRNTEKLRKRPLFFVAHSFGGIILAHCLVKAVQTNENDHPTIASLYKATYGILLFGIPHKGLLVDDIQKMLGGQENHPRSILLQQIKSKSDLLADQLVNFKNLIWDRKIVSFYETGQTRQLEFDSESKRWKRTGNFVTAVDTDSALLQLPDFIEEKIPLDSDHSMIVKFDNRHNRGYTSARDKLRLFEKDAPSVVAARFSQANYVGHYSYTSPHPVKTYVQRPELCDQIRKQLHDSPSEDTNGASRKHGRKVLAVWGLGGAGKTQLVLDYLQRYREEYKATFWIEAGRKASIERDLTNMYKLLYNVPISTGMEAVKIDDAVIAVKNWFSSRRDQWLLVFDGADSIDDEEEGDFFDLAHYMPESPAMHVIVTTRSRTAKDITMLEGVNVGEMDQQQAVDLFYKSSGVIKCDNNTEEVERIVKELGCLALAVNLAGTYVSRTPRLFSDIRSYLPEYGRRRQELLSRRPEKLVHQYGQSVLTTWETSFRAVNQQSAGAAKFLTMLAFLNFDDIYLELFGMSIGPQEAGHPERPSRHSIWRTTISPGKEIDVYELEEYFDILQKYSFVQLKSDQNSYSMHKLVHAWGYDRLQSEERQDFSLGALQLVCEVVTSRKEKPYEKLRLLPHLMANFDAVAKSKIGLERVEQALGQLTKLGSFTSDIGRWSEAFSIRIFVVEEWRAMYGEEHPSTISAMSNLAITLWDQGKHGEAAAMIQKVLEKRRRILGEGHLDTIKAIDNLAITLEDQGKHGEAAAMKQEVLEKRRRILGEEHPDTISAMNNLAITLWDQGKHGEAAAMIQKVLEKRRRILGEGHPDTIKAMNNLANTLGDQGKHGEAAAMKQEVLEKMRRILGEEHPDTISAMNNLANTLRDQGKHGEAAAMKQEVLEKRRRILGEEHPDTISAMNNLAITLEDQGKHGEAAAMKQEVLEKRRRILGEEHLDTITAMNNLAITLRDQGKHGEAAAMKQEVLEKRRRILGEEHPDTITAMNNLAITLGHQGKHGEAAAMEQEVLEKRRRILGEEHLDTITAMNNLAITLRDQGKHGEAAAMKQEVLGKRRRIF